MKKNPRRLLNRIAFALLLLGSSLVTYGRWQSLWAASSTIPIVVFPAVTFTPTSLSFPPTDVGTSASLQTFTITNTAPPTVGIASISIAGTNPGDFSQSTTCGATLTFNSTCAITVTFAPLAVGSRSAIVNIVNTTTPAHTYSASVLGTGVIPTNQNIASLNLSSTGFTVGGSGATVGAISAAMSPASPTFSGSFALSTSVGLCNGTNGADNSKFTISSGNLVTAVTTTAGTYNVCLTATQAGISNSPFSQAFVLTGSSGVAACGGEAVPTPAANAGFTTCAADYDWTVSSTSSWTPALSGPVSTISNWLDCTARGSQTNTAVPWHWGNPGEVQATPCNFTIVNDGGVQVLSDNWLHSYSSTGCNNSGNGFNCVIGMQGPLNSCTGTSCTYGVGTSFSTGLYLETIARACVLPISTCGTGGSYADDENTYMWSSTIPAGFGPGPPGYSQIEIDMDELSLSNGGSATDGIAAVTALWHSYAAINGCGNIVATNCNNFLPAGYAINQYHKYGLLQTTNPSTGLTYDCIYIDNLLQNCGQGKFYNIRPWLVVGANGAVGGDSIYGPDQSYLIKYIKVWACANWATTQCQASTLFANNGPPANYYYH